MKRRRRKLSRRVFFEDSSDEASDEDELVGCRKRRSSDASAAAELGNVEGGTKRRRTALHLDVGGAVREVGDGRTTEKDGRKDAGKTVGGTSVVGPFASAASRLPLEIISYIVCLVPPGSRFSCALVNKMWLAAAMPVLWEVLDINADTLEDDPACESAKTIWTRHLRLAHYGHDDEEFEEFLEFIPLVPDRYPNLRTFVVETIPLDVAVLAQMFASCPNLTALAMNHWRGRISGATIADGRSIPTLLSAGFAALKCFRVKRAPTKSNMLASEMELMSIAISNFGPNLRSLTFELFFPGANTDNRHFFHPLAQQCPNIEYLSLLTVRDPAPIISASPRLKQLWCRHSRAVIDALANCKDLKRLCLDLCGYDDRGGFKLSRWVEAFGITGNSSGYEVWWTKAVKHFRCSLQVLDARAFRFGEAADLIEKYRLPSLRVLHLSDGGGNEESLWSIIELCPRLEKVLVDKVQYPDYFIKRARRRGIEIRPRLWRDEEAVCVDVCTSWFRL
ncbi:hypothetical protein HK104_007812 [Borealophlyctis nickersoniae]|nr:hypothetical protein HK104_007812 [Borealophlyctis nickersoniae]